MELSYRRGTFFLICRAKGMILLIKMKTAGDRMGLEKKPNHCDLLELLHGETKGAIGYIQFKKET